MTLMPDRGPVAGCELKLRLRFARWLGYRSKFIRTTPDRVNGPRNHLCDEMEL